MALCLNVFLVGFRMPCQEDYFSVACLNNEILEDAVLFKVFEIAKDIKALIKKTKILNGIRLVYVDNFSMDFVPNQTLTDTLI